MKRLLYIMCVALAACGGGRKGASADEKAKSAEVTFSADSAYGFVAQQVAFGPRMSGTEAHRACAAFLEQTLWRLGAEVTVQRAEARRYDGTAVEVMNIIGAYNPEQTDRVMLCAHWDTRPWADQEADRSRWHTPIPGANDGASGVGVLLEVARQLQAMHTGLGVDIIFFDAEDVGTPQFEPQRLHADETWCLGSQYWARHPHRSGYRARYALLLDMVGAPDAQFMKEYFSVQYASDVVDRVWKAALAQGCGHWFADRRGPALTDDHYFINTIAHIPCVDIIHYNAQGDTGFADYWHTLDDDMNHVSPMTLEAVGRTVLATILQ